MNTITLDDAMTVTRQIQELGDPSARLIIDYESLARDGAACVAWSCGMPQLVGAAIVMVFQNHEAPLHAASLAGALITETHPPLTAYFVSAPGWGVDADTSAQ